MARLAKYTESILVVNTLTDTLVAAEGATVHVYFPDTTTDMTIYSDSAGAVSISQPITLGENGLLQFYVRSQDRTFDLNFAAGLSPLPQFTTFTLPDVSATYDDSVFYASEYSSLQAAIDATTAGSKLVIDEDFTTTAVTVLAKSDIVIEGFNRGIRIRLTTDVNDNVLELAGARITLRNLEIDGNGSNQAGAGPYHGVVFTNSSSDCLIEDLYIHSCKGDGVIANYLSSSTFRRVTSTANMGYGFSYDATGASLNVTFDDCIASANGTDAGLARLDGFYFSPPIGGLSLVNCRALTNIGHGIHIAGNATSATIKRTKLIGCTATDNGSGSSRSGLKIVSNSNAGTIIQELEITGGHYSDNTLYGIHLEASESATNPGTADVIRGFQINGVSCCENGVSGIRIHGRISYGQISSPILYNNAALAAGTGIEILGATATNALADFGDEGRCRWIVVNSPVVSRDAGAGAHAYGMEIGLGTKHIVVNDLIAVGTANGVWTDAGKGNIVRTVHLGPTAGAGIGGGGGFPAMALHTDTSYGAGLGKFWLTGRTKTVSGTETRIGSPRVSSRTRVLSLIPLDISAGYSLFGSTANGWYQDVANTVSGSATAASVGATANMGYVTIKTVGNATNYASGEFLLLCADSITGV